MSKRDESLEGRYVIENIGTGRYLFQTDKPPAGTEVTFPKCVGADANYLGRAVWIVSLKEGHDDKYRIQNEATKSYLYQTGKRVESSEGGWGNAPSTVCVDDPNLYEVFWSFSPSYNEGYLIRNVETKRYVFQTGNKIVGDHGSEEGWKDAPKVVGTDKDYYGYAGWKLIRQ